MKRRDLIKKLENAGFKLARNGGNHDVYTRGKDIEQVPRHTENRNKREISKSNSEKVGAGLSPHPSDEYTLRNNTKLNQTQAMEAAK